jgi:hypothetical protein
MMLFLSVTLLKLNHTDSMNLLHPNLDAVVDGFDEILFGSEVAFRGLNTGMAEQQLDLFEIAASLSA